VTPTGKYVSFFHTEWVGTVQCTVSIGHLVGSRPAVRKKKKTALMISVLSKCNMDIMFACTTFRIAIWDIFGLQLLSSMYCGVLTCGCICHCIRSLEGLVLAYVCYTLLSYTSLCVWEVQLCIYSGIAGKPFTSCCCYRYMC